MANPSADRTNRRDTRSGATVSPESAVPLGAMQEPLGSMERPISNSSDTLDGRDYRDPSVRESSVPARTDRGFTTTFALAAVVLLVAFMVALYFGSTGSDVTNTASDTSAPVTETAPANGDAADTTGSTTAAPDAASPEATGSTTAPVVEPQPGTANSGTTGTTGSTNP